MGCAMSDEQVVYAVKSGNKWRVTYVTGGCWWVRCRASRTLTVSKDEAEGWAKADGGKVVKVTQRTKPKTLQLKVGCFYETSDGRAAVIAQKVASDVICKWDYRGVILADSPLPHRWDEQGNAVASACSIVKRITDKEAQRRCGQ